MLWGRLHGGERVYKRALGTLGVEWASERISWRGWHLWDTKGEWGVLHVEGTAHWKAMCWKKRDMLGKLKATQRVVGHHAQHVCWAPFCAQQWSETSDLLAWTAGERLNQSCHLSEFSQAACRRPWVCLKVQGGLRPITLLGPKNCPFLCGKISALTQWSKTHKKQWVKGARRLLVCGMGTFVSNNKSPGRLVIWLFRKRALAVGWIMKNYNQKMEHIFILHFLFWDCFALYHHRRQVLVRYMEEISEIVSFKMDS